MIAKFVGRSVCLNDHVRQLATEKPLSLIEVRDGESPTDIANRIQALFVESKDGDGHPVRS